jgi:hypothetical protein
VAELKIAHDIDLDSRPSGTIGLVILHDVVVRCAARANRSSGEWFRNAMYFNWGRLGAVPSKSSQSGPIYLIGGRKSLT